MSTIHANGLSAFSLPLPLRRTGQELLDHQCWVFGRDVLCSTNNLLIQYGFQQVRCPRGGLTQYELRDGLGTHSHVFLWGFGVFFGSEEEGIFLTRSGFAPFRTQGKVELHVRDVHPFSEESSDLELLLRGLGWFAAYEDWIAREASDSHQRESIEKFPRKTLERCDLAGRWRDLALTIATDLKA
jgi:hypothetical protein